MTSSRDWESRPSQTLDFICADCPTTLLNINFQGSIMLRVLPSFLLLSALAPLCFGAETPMPAAPMPAAPMPAAPMPAAPIPTAPTVDARSYILVDYRTDKI